MKTVLLIAAMALLLLIATQGKADTIIDELTERQYITDYQEPGIIKKTSSKQIDNDELGPLNRTLLLNTPNIKSEQSSILINNEKLDINIEENTNAAIVYDFNNFNLSDYDGIMINKSPGGTGQIQLITNGPAGISKSPMIELNHAMIYAPLKCFTGSKLFNNLTRIKINMTKNTHYRGNLSIELLKNAPLPVEFR